MTQVGPSDRGVAMVFQSYALYPHMTVAENIGFGLKMTGHDRAEIAKRTAAAAKMLQLDNCWTASGATVRWPAPAGCHRPRHRAQPGCVPVR